MVVVSQTGRDLARADGLAQLPDLFRQPWVTVTVGVVDRQLCLERICCLLVPLGDQPEAI